MTPAQIRRHLLILQQERQKGFLAWKQLLETSTMNSKDDEGTDVNGSQPSSPLTNLPLSAQGEDTGGT